MSERISPDAVLGVALNRAGTQVALARILGVTQQYVSKRLKAKKPVSAEEAVLLERELGIPRDQSRPDLFERADSPIDGTSALLEANR